MSALGRPPSAPPRVLVVDDDRRVVELLEIAYGAQGFEVLTAVDGDDAYRKAVNERPDLIVLDVRLPKRSGFEVCEALRREHAEDAAPVILVSAAGETEARLHGLAAGADDFLPKPFSPKELLARSRRLLARAGEVREARRRGAELERELARARDEVRRSHVETRREQRLRELAFGVGRDLHRTLDFETLARRFLGVAQSRLSVSTAALLGPDGDGARLEALCVRGDAFERVAGLTLPLDGALAARLVALGRPTLRRELERLPEMAGAIPALVAAGFVLVAPLTGPDGLEGVLLTDERLDGLEPQPHDLELVAGLCDLVAGALRNARRYRVPLEHAVELLAGVAGHAGDAPLRAEAAALADRAARATLLPPRTRGLLAHVVRLGAAFEATAVRTALERFERDDATGWIADLRELAAVANAPVAPADDGDPVAARAALLAAFARRLVIARTDGDALEPAAVRVLDSLDDVLDAGTREALIGAVRETLTIDAHAA